MKQGTGKSTMSGGKVEPKSTAIGVGAVSRIGVHEIKIHSGSTLNQGRGFEAPKPVSCTGHKCGSQGKH